MQETCSCNVYVCVCVIAENTRSFISSYVNMSGLMYIILLVYQLLVWLKLSFQLSALRRRRDLMAAFTLQAV